MNEEEKKRLDESEVVGDESSEASSEVANESESQAETDNTQPTMSEPEPEAVETAVSEDENGDESVPEPEAEPQPQPQQQQPMEKMLTQSQVNELVGRARQEGRESALKELYGRYGVSGDSELNDVFGRGQAYLTLDDDFKAEQSSNKALLAENALLKTKVDESRWEDIKAILGSKNMDITPENIEAEIPTHPEWRQQIAAAAQPQQQQPQQPQQDSLQPQQQQQAVLRKLGSESTAKGGGNGDDEESEQERAMKLFGFNK